MDYNALGQLTDYTYPDGKTVHYTYDALSRLDSMRVSHGALLQTTSYSYEGDSPSVNQVILPNGQIINYDYDEL